MKIQEIYDRYKIMPQLQLHMLRVAGVASMICDNFEKKINKNRIIGACLLHDIGNIIKSDLDLFPELLKEKGINYWKEVKRNFIDTYGNDEHKATLTIINEINPDKYVSNILQNLKFSNTIEIVRSGNTDKKIVKYSDLRVTPFGINTLKERLKEAKNRYVHAKNIWSESEFNKFTFACNNIEHELFSFCRIKPENITEEKVKPLFKQLRDFEISTSVEP
jgi:HD superfamily phosphohydrolase